MKKKSEDERSLPKLSKSQKLPEKRKNTKFDENGRSLPKLKLSRFYHNLTKKDKKIRSLPKISEVSQTT